MISQQVILIGISFILYMGVVGTSDGTVDGTVDGTELGSSDGVADGVQSTVHT